MMPKDDLDSLRDRLVRVRNGEVWGNDHPGPFTAEEKAAEIARLESLVASLEAPAISS
jgi:hypothetical protein